MAPPEPAAPVTGLRWPAEWEPHDATWLAWPHKEASWPGKFERVPPVFVEMVRALVPGERVEILVRDGAMESAVAARLAEARLAGADVRLHRIATDDAWIRDHGPTFVVDEAARELLAVDWDYNAWGGKYPPWESDARVARAIAEIVGCSSRQPRLILEGGSIEGDGEGTLLTTESCLLNRNRNPALDRAAIEQHLRAALGVSTILWLGDGIAGDDTDGHVDDLTRFVAPGRVVTVLEDDPRDVNYNTLRANRERLVALRDARGRQLDVIPLPMPAPVLEVQDRLPASYANFYIGNEAVLVPVFGCSADREAMGILGELFPGRRVTGIPARDLVWGLGACHCLTQQQPRVPAL